jgi:lactocepin
MKKFLGRFVITLIVISLVAGLGFSSINAANDDNPFTIRQLQEARQNYIKSNSNLPAGSTLPGKGLTAPTDGPIIPEDVKNTDLYKSGWIKVSVDVDGAPLAEYATSKGKTTKNIDKNEAKAYVNTLKAAHSYLKSVISANGIGMRAVKDMFVAYNGFGAEVRITDLAKLFNTFGSDRVHVATLYKIDDGYSNTLIGADTAWSDPGVDGTGMYVGILDTGVDYTHPDLGGGWGVKVVAGYSFEEGISDPMDCNGHGTHVAGIIAANGLVKGVAPEAKIVFAKIVQGCEGSAWDTTIAEAFDYMADPDNLDDGPEGTHPPVASVNMSFGSDSGFVDPTAPDQQAIENCIANGIVVSLSAGNAYDSYTYNFGYPPFFPDYATVGSPSVTPNSIAVGASWNTTSRYVALREISSGNLYAYTVGGDSHNPVIYLGDNGGAGYSYVYCGLGGSLSDFPADVAGKIALIQRGSYNFSVKIANAAAGGAIGAIIFNNAGNSLITMNTGGETLPAIFIGQSAGIFLQSKATITGDGTGRVAFSSSYYLDINNGALADKMVNFSSWGPPPDLSFKPDITAPGGGIWSTVPIAQGSYDDYSGTSMAAPHIAACAALLLEEHPNWTPEQVKIALMNTAELLIDPASGLPYSPHLMGAGRVNVYDALHNDVALTNLLGNPYVALGDLPNYKSTPVSFTLTLTNNSSSDVTYDISSTAQNTGVLLNSSSLGSIVSTIPSGSVTVTAGGSTNVIVNINTTVIADWTGSPYYGFPYLEGFVSFVPQGSGVTLHIPYMGFLGNWNDFNEADWQFNPLMDPPADDPMNFASTYLFDYPVTWPEITDGTHWYLTGVDFDGNLDSNAIAFNSKDYMLEANLWLLRNAENLTVSITDSHGKVINTIDSVNQLYKMNWYSSDPYTNAPWWWNATSNNGKKLLPDGLYHLVLTATAPKQFDKGSYDPPQIIDFPVMVDTQNPKITVTEQSDNGDGTTKITWNTVDPVFSSGIWGYLVRYSIDNWKSYTDEWVSPTENNFNVPRSAKVIITAFDNAGNADFVRIVATKK